MPRPCRNLTQRKLPAQKERPRGVGIYRDTDGKKHEEIRGGWAESLFCHRERASRMGSGQRRRGRKKEKMKERDERSYRSLAWVVREERRRNDRETIL